MNRKNNITLKRIYKRATQSKTNIKIPGWYKISKGGKCPDKDDYGNISGVIHTTTEIQKKYEEKMQDNAQLNVWLI
jgi:hypothetical protein